MLCTLMFKADLVLLGSAGVFSTDPMWRLSIFFIEDFWPIIVEYWSVFM